MRGTSGKYVIGFPNQLASDAEKASKEYGLMVGHAIESEWFRKEGGRSRFYNNRDTYHKLRTYAMGEQPVEKYKNELSINGDLSYLNLDWTPVPIIPKFVDIVVNGISNRLFDVKAEAIDPVSSNKKAMYKNRIQTEMRNKEDFEEIGAMLGKDMFSVQPDMLPETDDELDIHMQIDYKDDIEIAEEKAITSVLKHNNYEHIKKRIDEDSTVIGVSAAKHTFNTHDGIKVDYVDPADLVFSPTEDPHFQDCYYFGEVKNVNITELKKIDPSLSQEEIDEIAKSSSKFDAYQGMRAGYQTDTFDINTATLLYFCYKTDKNIVYKKKKNAQGGEKVLKKDDQFNPPKTEQARFEKLSKKIDVWYEGVLVLNTHYILKWELMKNMVRPKSAVQKVYAPYIVSAPKMYRGQVDSLVKRMIPFADQIQLTHMKLQQIVSKMIPDGVYLDIDGLSSINLGNGATYTPQEALNLFFQTGSVIGRSYTEEGEYNHGKVPVQELTSSGANSKISSLVNYYNYTLGMLRSVTGLNEARDGSTPDPNSLVGLQKLAALNSNTATRHILDSSLYIFRGLSEALTYRIADILEYSDFKDDFVNKIGRYNVSILNDISDLYIYDFGVFLEVAPDEEDRAKLEQNIQMALSRGDIYLEDAIDIRELKNIKLANQLLKLKRKKKQEKEQQIEMQKQAMVAQQNMQSQQMAAQTAMQKIQAETQSKMQIKQAEIAFEMEKMKGQAMLKSQLMAEEFKYNLELKGLAEDALQKRENQREDAKKSRISQQNTQQSQLINQRKNNLPSINFESNEDSLDGFDLSEFSPR